MGAQRRRCALATHQVRIASGSRSAQRGRRVSARAVRPRMSAVFMQPLTAMRDTARRAIRGVLADIDDTISTGGRVTAEAYAAMERLRRAGLLLIPITGRPAGWCDHIARVWPVDAVVGENGALYMIHDDRARKLVKRYA